MAIVKNNLFEDGDIPTGAELNQPYDDVATASGALDPQNTADNWITIAHVLDPNAFNQIYDFVYDGQTADNINSTSYVPIQNVAPNYSEVILNYQPEQYEVLRVECSGLVTTNEAEATYDAAALPPNGDRNYYAFRLSLFYNDGGPTSQLTLGEWGYSFTSMAGGTSRYWTTNNGLPNETGVPLAYQTFQFSALYIENAGVGRTLEKIELQAKVNYSGNTLAVGRNNIVAVRARR
jgi:hypothetical protein